MEGEPIGKNDFFNQKNQEILAYLDYIMKSKFARASNTLFN